jgi:uncharacterized protein (DUF983 family)
MSAPEAACCPACGVPVDLMRIASMPDFDRYICKSCKASLQRTSPADPASFGIVMLGIIVGQLLQVSLWFLLLLPIVFLVARARVKRRLPTVTFKLAEPWSLRS